VHKNTTKLRLKVATYHNCTKLTNLPIFQYNDQLTFFSIPTTLIRKNNENVDAHTSLSEIKNKSKITKMNGKTSIFNRV
jgi:hypothetical protein